MTEALPLNKDNPGRMNFRSASRVRMDPGKAKRQGEVTSLAFIHLGGREHALAFLNNHDVDLDGRPIDIAIASEEGCGRVRDAILKFTAQQSGD